MCATQFGRAASRREAAFAAAHRMCATAARALPRRALATPVAHRACVLAWTCILGLVFAWVLFWFALVWPLALTAELLFRVYLAARVRMLHDRKAHVPASLRVRRLKPPSHHRMSNACLTHAPLVAHQARMTPAERTASLARVLEAIAHANGDDAAPHEGIPRFLSLWHCNAPFASLRRSHMRRFLAAHFLFAELDALSAPQHAELEALLRSLEQQIGTKFPDGGEAAATEELLTRAMRVSMPEEPMRWLPYPLVLYAAFAAMDVVARLVLRLFGFRHHTTPDGTLSYFHRPATSAAPPPPVVLLPGIGIGPAGYVPLLLRVLCADGAAAFLVELPHVAAGRLHGGVPEEEAAAAALLAMLRTHGEASARWVAHSYGSFVLAWLLRHADGAAKAAVRSAVLLDPAAVLVAFPHVLHGAVYRRPLESPLAVQACAAAAPACSRLGKLRASARLAMAYAVTKEAHIALAVQRHTFWPSASLWLDDLPAGCHVTVALSEGDVLLPTREVAAYAAAMGARSAAHGVSIDVLWLRGHEHGEVALNPAHWECLSRSISTGARAGPPHGE